MQHSIQLVLNTVCVQYSIKQYKTVRKYKAQPSFRVFCFELAWGGGTPALRGASKHTLRFTVGAVESQAHRLRNRLPPLALHHLVAHRHLLHQEGALGRRGAARVHAEQEAPHQAALRGRDAPCRQREEHTLLGSTMQSHVLKRWFHLGVGQSIDRVIYRQPPSYDTRIDTLVPNMDLIYLFICWNVKKKRKKIRYF